MHLPTLQHPLAQAILAGTCTFIVATGVAVLLALGSPLEIVPRTPAMPVPRNGVLVLDGSSALLCPGAVPADMAFTMECWASGGPPAGRQVLIGNNYYTGVALYWSMEPLGLTTPSAWVSVTHVPGTKRRGYVIAQSPNGHGTRDR